MNSLKMRQLIDDQLAGINYKSIEKPNKMAVEINCTQIEDNIILVNGKEVRKDMDGTWIAKDRFSMIEAKFFGEFRETLKRCRSAQYLTATYKI